MQGRYAGDQLGNFLMWIYIALFVVYLFTRLAVLYLAALALMIYAFFRMFSRNINARHKENMRYLAVKRKIKGFFKLIFDRVRDCRKRVYKKCPHCKAIVRLPRKGGKHSAVCPVCKKRFSLRVLAFGAIISIFISSVIVIGASITLAVIFL